MKELLAFLVVLGILVGAIGAASVVTTGQTPATATAPGGCAPASGVYRSQLSPQSFGEVTSYSLPKPLRAPNSIAAGPSGSIWFGEVGLRGVAHLYENGTLLEYPWPASFYGAGTNCYDLTQLWGVVIWQGLVWASDHFDGQLVGLNSSDDSFQTIPLKAGDSPQFLAIGPTGDLWFTTTASPAQIGVVDASSHAVTYFSVPAPPGEFAASLAFDNSTLAFVAAVSSTNNQGEVLSFDPAAPSSTFSEIGGNQTLLGPYSMAMADGGLWVGEHDASNLAFYNMTSRGWSFYPTSLNPEVPLTLPYYLIANGTGVWFNEHDSNRVGVVCCGGASLTEYNASMNSLKRTGIGNLLTIGLSNDLVWFTEWTGNSVGFVNASLAPPFSVSVAGARTVTLAPGSSGSLDLSVSGNSSRTLLWQFSDSESHTSVPVQIAFATDPASLVGLDGSRDATLTVSASAATPPGGYLLLVTLTDGFTYRSVYVHLEIT